MPVIVFPQVFRPALAHLALLGLLALSASSCASTGPYTWYRDVPGQDWKTDVTEYVISVGDTISISVYEQAAMSTTVKIRRDGRVALPLIGEITAAGKHPSELAREVEGRVKEFIVSPRVTINVDTWQPVTVTAIGEIAHIGAVTLEPPARLIEAIAQAGGPNDFADRSRIFVLRQFPKFQRIRFTYDAIVHNEEGAAGFPLHTGDVIVIE